MKCALSLVTLFLMAALVHSYPAELAQKQLGNQNLDDDLWKQRAGEKIEKYVARVKREITTLTVLNPSDPFAIEKVPFQIRICFTFCRSRNKTLTGVVGTFCECT